MPRHASHRQAPQTANQPGSGKSEGVHDRARPFEVRGLMMDCARLLEQPGYYYHLVDLMANWGYNLLVLHFSDDHGCSVKLPGLAHLAVPHAMTPQGCSRQDEEVRTSPNNRERSRKQAPIGVLEPPSLGLRRIRPEAGRIAAV